MLQKLGNIEVMTSAFYKGMASSHFKYAIRMRYYSSVLDCSNSENRHFMRVLNENARAPVGDMYVKVAGNGSENVSKSVYLKFREDRIFFNCGQSGESTTRGGLNHILVTHLDWIKIGGIISSIYKASSSNREELTLYGPPGLDVLIRASESFLRLDNLTINILDSCDFKSDVLKIKSVPLRFKNEQTLKSSKVDKALIRRKHYSVTQDRSILQKEPKHIVDLNVAYSYIIKISTRNAWVLSECVKRGVKPGENMLKLWRGESVVLDDGSVVNPDDVTRKENFPDLIVLDVPSTGYLEDLLQKEEYHEIFSKEPCIIIHFSPENVMNDKRYISWMQRFSPKTQHLIVNESNEWDTPQRVLNRQEVCRLINSQFFPKLNSNRERNLQDHPYYKVQNSQQVELQSYVSQKNSVQWLQRWKSIPENIQLVQSWPGTTINFKTLSATTYFQPILVSEEPAQSSDVIKNFSKTSPGNPKITFLGTSSQSNSAYRNSSGILLELSDNYSIMLDCGDGIMHQLACLYKKTEMEKVITSLRCILVSHPHADHHAGLIGLLLAIRKCTTSKKNKQKVVLLLPPVLIDWLESYHHKFQPILDNVVLISLLDMVNRYGNTDEKINIFLKNYLGMKQVLVCPAIHCAFAFSITFQHRSGWKISYSGDTRYNRNFAKIGKNSDLLIHEATFGTGLDTMAKQGKHSTTADALAVGKAMCAKQIVLTHFSKRYPTIPCLTDLDHTSNVSVAFDFLQCHLSNFQYLPKLNKTYKKVFANYELENREEYERFVTREKLLTEISKRT